MSSIPLHRGRSAPRLGLTLAWGALAFAAWRAWDLLPELAPTGALGLALGLALCASLLLAFGGRSR